MEVDDKLRKYMLGMNRKNANGAGCAAISQSVESLKFYLKAGAVKTTFRLEDAELFVVDVGGVLRDTTELDSKSFEVGFKAASMEYWFDATAVWHLKGLGRYKNRKKCINALLAISDLHKEAELTDILKKPDAEEFVTALIQEHIAKKGADAVEKTVQVIYDEYGKFFNSEEGKKLVETIPGSQEAMSLLKQKGYKVTLFSNGGRNAVERDVPYCKILDAVICKEDIAREKPSGEGIVKAAQLLGVPVEKTIYIGDAVVDIWASRDAGCRSLIVFDNGMSFPEQIAREKPDFTFNNIMEVAYAIKAKQKSMLQAKKIKTR
ncbi:MAG: HAD family hydrolase [Candidatus Marsarchaeota archaeon]|nr:HAD family hydrolase [Candidatus Marsarchaeota archaeon]MCL5106442.1 HAD family hydrolase [Candidatus Marsarchaeota archaeon]